MEIKTTLKIIEDNLQDKNQQGDMELYDNTVADKKWILVDELNKELGSVMNVRNDEKEMRRIIIDMQLSIKR